MSRRIAIVTSNTILLQHLLDAGVGAEVEVVFEENELVAPRAPEAISAENNFYRKSYLLDPQKKTHPTSWRK